jgi:hypothetical protein
VRCPTCGSTQPSMHPAVGGGGEVTKLCQDEFHGRYRFLAAYKPGNPTWIFTEEDFCLKLGIPENANVIFVGIDTFEGKITVVGSSR